MTDYKKEKHEADSEVETQQTILKSTREILDDAQAE